MSSTLEIVGLIFGTGFVAAVTAFATLKGQKRKINAEAQKVEAEASEIALTLPGTVDLTNIEGSKAAVLLMSASLESAHQEIERMRQQRIDDRKEYEAARQEDTETIRKLQGQVEELQNKVIEANRAAADAMDFGNRIRQELEQLRLHREKRDK